MRKVLLALAMTLVAFMAQAVPAHPQPVTVTQSDGSQLTVCLIGDEFYQYNTTIDGYTVQRQANGDYCYVVQRGSELVPTSQVAHNPEARNAAEQQLLAATAKNLVSLPDVEAAKASRLQRDRDMGVGEPKKARRTSFKGLVVLIDYTDVQFSRSDAHELYNNMMNQENYTGYTAEDGSEDIYGSQFIGSLHDYFSQNTAGQFNCTFDVVGPVQSSYTSTYVERNSLHRYEVFNEALDLIDDQVNFADYDGDGDGVVDMVYFIVAGNGSNFSGNDGNLLWPHASWMYLYDAENELFYYYVADDVLMGRYACSTELYGWTEVPSSVFLDGIGTICHEFSHVLGLPDLYDTDYSGSGGQSDHPAQWNLMAGGSYLMNARVPCGWSVYERLAGGYLDPIDVDHLGTYTLGNMQQNNQGARIATDTEGDIFLLENRQQVGWDTYLPGHGLLVYHVDSTRTELWENNRVNANPEQQCFVLLRAGNGTGATESDPFPGSSNVTSLTNSTTPSLVNAYSQQSPWELRSIVETNGGVIIFSTTDDPIVPRGDINGDGLVDVNDVSALIDVILGTASANAELHDINYDGMIDVDDVTELINIILGK